MKFSETKEVKVRDRYNGYTGGALPRRAEAVPSVSRQQIDMESKIGIARAAAEMIRDRQVVLIDGGTTNLRIASYLSRERSATFVTKIPQLALALADQLPD